MGFTIILGSDSQEIKTGIKKFFDAFGGLLHGRLHSTKPQDLRKITKLRLLSRHRVRFQTTPTKGLRKSY